MYFPFVSLLSYSLTCFAGLQRFPWIRWGEWREGGKGEPHNSLFSILLKTFTLGRCGPCCVADGLSVDSVEYLDTGGCTASHQTYSSLRMEGK